MIRNHADTAGVPSPLEEDQRALLALKNLGPATLGYFLELGVMSVPALAEQNADKLYVRLQAQRQAPFDPCLHDTFAAVIHGTRTGEKKPWYAYTAERKPRDAKGKFGLHRVPQRTPKRGA